LPKPIAGALLRVGATAAEPAKPAGAEKKLSIFCELSKAIIRRKKVFAPLIRGDDRRVRETDRA